MEMPNEASVITELTEKCNKCHWNNFIINNTFASIKEMISYT